MTDFFIDIGNTRIKYTCNQQPFTMQFSEHAKLAPVFSAITAAKPHKVLIASGRSESAQRAKSNLIAHTHAHNIDSVDTVVDTKLLTINYADASQFGTDRFLNLLAGRERYHNNFCVISAGTAITLDFYTDTHIGGMILLGLGSTKQILTEKTGLTTIRKPKTLLGNDTASSIGAGLYTGLQNLIDSSIARISQENGIAFHPIWTGGDAEALYSQGTIIPELLFEGMHYYNQQITS